jgi:hypothetical protein
MKILKKGGVVEKRGEEETKSMPHAPVILTLKSIPSVFMYAMNIQNDVIGLVPRENCKSKQMTDIIA